MKRPGSANRSGPLLFLGAITDSDHFKMGFPNQVHTRINIDLDFSTPQHFGISIEAGLLANHKERP